MFTQAQMIQETRQMAKELGLTFKRHDNKATFNGQPLYKFVTRGTNDTVISNMTANSAYQTLLSGWKPQ